MVKIKLKKFSKSRKSRKYKKSSKSQKGGKLSNLTNSMPYSNSSKQKLLNSLKRGINSEHKQTQQGGTSSSCTLPYSIQTPKYSGIGTSNLHNTNPQASLDLDNKFMGYGGPIPLGSSIVGGGNCGTRKNKSNRKHKGGSSCGSEGVGTGSPKNQTFKEYLNNLDANLSSVTGGSSTPSPNSKPNQIGSGYSSDPSEFIGGKPVYKAYDDNSPPAIINGGLVFGSPDQPVCGSGVISGGARRLCKRSKKNKSSNKNKKSKSQKGGDFTTSRISKPADYSTAYNGESGYFKYPDDMTGRSFEARQPNWGVNGI